MADSNKRTPGLIVSALIIILSIIHLGVGIGVVARFRQYDDIFRQSVGLCAFNIVIGIYGFVIGILCLVGVLRQQPALSKSAAVCGVILGFFAGASFIAALVINSQNVTFMRERLLYRLNTYAATDSSTEIMDQLQSRYQCCGVNVWLDYATVSLGTTSSGVGGSSVTGRRRRQLERPPSPLVKLIRRRQTTGLGYPYYNLPTGYTLNIPISCCRSGSGQSTGGNTLGGYCVASAGNSTSAFYVQGCLPTLANHSVSQVTGIAVINIVLLILAIVLLPILMTMFPEAFDPNNPNNKQPLSNEMQQDQQMKNGGYYAYNNYADMNNVNMNNGNMNMDPNAYYNYPQAQAQAPYVVYQ